MEEAIQTALQEEYSHKQARTPVTAWQGNSQPSGMQSNNSGNGTTTGRCQWT
ncbi:hypothetical protein PC110_g7791 [Phytophthora cactorum]|uniref:Uncharacterized protein n=1 Tax=Phytophthora cactorum TaxID=29920 RepID=A0A329SIJ4_9STRA|nr:hypothetical protein PC117_g5576 [Phytophthora cactorum]KAG3187924.1 hypothetical protein C6341_g2982 [Phytophthora cactorum]RAW35936.1 hypothetical protein PC110_g7791 [Phytophthora cactorum]